MFSVNGYKLGTQLHKIRVNCNPLEILEGKEDQLTTGAWTAHLPCNRNLTCEMVEKNIGRAWDWFELSQNPNITWDVVYKHRDKPWKMRYISGSRHVTCEIVRNHPEIAWDYLGLACNPNLTWEFAKENLHKFGNSVTIHGACLARHPCVTWEIFRNCEFFTSVPLRVRYFCIFNPNLTRQIVQENPNFDWEGNGFFHRAILSARIDLNPPCPPWGFIPYENLTWEIVHKHLDQYDTLWNPWSCRASVTCDIIEANMDRPWNWYWVTRNPNLTWEFVEKYKDKPWDWKYMIRLPIITYEIVCNNPTRFSIQEFLIENPNVTVKILQKINSQYFGLLPWFVNTWGLLSCNPCMPYAYMKKNQSKNWNWNAMCQNEFLHDPRAYNRLLVNKAELREFVSVFYE